MGRPLSHKIQIKWWLQESGSSRQFNIPALSGFLNLPETKLHFLPETILNPLETKMLRFCEGNPQGFQGQRPVQDEMRIGVRKGKEALEDRLCCDWVIQSVPGYN